MPVQHKYRPKHLAFSIALAVGCAEFAAAQQTSTDQTSAPFETSEDLIMELDAFIGAADTQPHLINKIAEWRNLQLDERNDLVSVLSGGGMTKRLDGGGGINVIRLDHTKGGTLGETRDFAGLDIKQGTWTLNGGKDSGDFQIGALVRPQAMLTNNGHIEGRAVAQGTLVNNGSIGGNDYSVYSAPQDRDKLMVDAGVDLRLSARNTIGVGLSGEMGSDSRTHGVMGQWRMAF
jgi:hypothetical protein